MCGYASSHAFKQKLTPAPFSTTYFPLRHTALNIILRLRSRKFDTLFATGPLTLSKREPTFAVTSSTSVNVSMLTKTPPRRVWGTRQRRTSRPGRSDSRSRRLWRLCSARLRRDRQRSELPDMSAITRRRVRPECDWRRGSGSRHVPQPRSGPSSSRSWSVSQGLDPASSWLIGLVAS